MSAATILKRHVWPHGCTAIAIVRYGRREYAVREAGWCKSVHSTYTEALAAFNALIATGSAS